MGLVFLRNGRKGLESKPSREQRQMLDRLKALAADPTGRHAGVLAMQGEPPGRLRVRQGDWHAIVVIEGPDVIVTELGHRREVYR